MECELQKIPAAVDFEEKVIGAILNEPEHLPEIMPFLTPECFYEPINAKIFGTIGAMYEANEQIDLFTVMQRLKTDTELKEARADIRIINYTQQIALGVNLKSYAIVVKEMFVRRKLIISSHQIAAMANDLSTDLSDVLDFQLKTADSSNEIALGSSGARHIAKTLSEALKQAENKQIAAQSGQKTGVATGLTDLDRITGGWQPSQLIVLAARPAMGKTALMLHFAKEAARAGTPVCIYSLEMSDISLANRLLLSESDVEAWRFRSGQLMPEDWKQLESAASTLEKLPIYVDDNPVVSMRYIKSRSKLMQKKGRCGLILVDYLQLADTATDKKNRNREQEIAQASRQAKIIAKELNVPFILLSQLSRSVEGRSDKMPVLSDLRESGAIEQDADIVSFIYRPAYYKLETIQTESLGIISTEGLGVIAIAKQRDGATGQVVFRHNQSMTKIADFKPGETYTAKSPF